MTHSDTRPVAARENERQPSTRAQAKSGYATSYDRRIGYKDPVKKTAPPEVQGPNQSYPSSLGYNSGYDHDKGNKGTGNGQVSEKKPNNLNKANENSPIDHLEKPGIQVNVNLYYDKEGSCRVNSSEFNSPYPVPTRPMPNRSADRSMCCSIL